MFVKDGVQLLGNPNESSPLAHLLQLSSARVGTRRTQPPQEVKHGRFDWSSVVHLDALALGGAVLGHAPSIPAPWHDAVSKQCARAIAGRGQTPRGLISSADPQRHAYVCKQEARRPRQPLREEGSGSGGKRGCVGSLFHRHVAGHAIELLALLARALDDFTCAFIVARQHACSCVHA